MYRKDRRLNTARLLDGLRRARVSLLMSFHPFFHSLESCRPSPDYIANEILYMG